MNPKQKKEIYAEMDKSLKFIFWLPLTVVSGLAFFISVPTIPMLSLILLPMFLICAFRLHSIIDQTSSPGWPGCCFEPYSLKSSKTPKNYHASFFVKTNLLKGKNMKEEKDYRNMVNLICIMLSALIMAVIFLKVNSSIATTTQLGVLLCTIAFLWMPFALVCKLLIIFAYMSATGKELEKVPF